MKIFISSLISGMEAIRAAACEVVMTFRHQPIMAEDFSALPASPQLACLTELRQSDLVVLILGEQYGSTQPSGLSATHEEYRDAKSRKSVIAFVQDSAARDPQQAEFVKEVQAWEGGLFRGGFKTVADFRTALTRALHDHALANAVGPVDVEEVGKRAQSLLPQKRNGSVRGATLNMAIAGGPRQTILRPIEIENPALADALHQAALFGERRIFNPALGVDREIEEEALVLRQERDSNQISVNEQGSLLVSLAVPTGRMMMELVEEAVEKQLGDALAYGTWALDHIDSTQRLTHIAVAVSISGAEYSGWRTQRESDANPTSISIGSRGVGGGQRSPVLVSRTRAALRLDSARSVEDLTVLLRRQWR